MIRRRGAGQGGEGLRRSVEHRVRCVFADMGLSVLTMAAAFFLRFEVMDGRDPVGGLGFHLLWAAAFSPAFPILYALLGVYAGQPKPNALRRLGAVWLGNTLSVMGYIDVIYLFHVTDFSRRMLWIYWLLLEGNGALRVWGERFLAGPGEARKAIFIGEENGVRLLRSDPGIELTGSVGDRPIPGTAWLGPLEDLGKILLKEKPDLAVLTTDDGEHLSEQLHACDSAGVKPYLLPAGAEHLGSRPYLETVAGMPLLDLRRVPLDDPAADTLKRLGDILAAAALLLLCAPILLLAAAGTRLSSPGPVIFTQERVGRDNRVFKMYKFRSMAVGSDGGWTLAGDPRRTVFGAFMRRYSIDELPQLVNVLRGDMSLVGPRPELPCHVDRFRRSVPRYMVRHRVRPGLTGWAQVNGLRGDTSIPRRVEFDLYYIENWSLPLDLKILLLTPLRCLVNRQEPLKSPRRVRE